MMRRLLLLLAALLLGGCGTFADPTEWFAGPNVVKPSELLDLENKVQPQTLWSRDIGAGSDELSLNLEPQVRGDIVYVVDAEGLVQALDAKTGAVVWRVELDVPASGG
ncbi:MAG: PQQ-binding-like beta-propeller repeat protein, partial [Gammaproteobacteria bacterium]|nr:PQQ-binding-like beta-propeller repeat protein [Gammaproteobacteria bacterium]